MEKTHTQTGDMDEPEPDFRLNHLSDYDQLVASQPTFYCSQAMRVSVFER